MARTQILIQIFFAIFSSFNVGVGFSKLFPRTLEMFKVLL